LLNEGNSTPGTDAYSPLGKVDNKYVVGHTPQYFITEKRMGKLTLGILTVDTKSGRGGGGGKRAGEDLYNKGNFLNKENRSRQEKNCRGEAEP